MNKFLNKTWKVVVVLVTDEVKMAMTEKSKQANLVTCHDSCAHFLEPTLHHLHVWF